MEMLCTHECDIPLVKEGHGEGPSSIFHSEMMRFCEISRTGEAVQGTHLYLYSFKGYTFDRINFPIPDQREKISESDKAIVEQFEALQTQAAAAVQSSKKESVHKSAEEIEEESKCLLERLEEVKGVKEDVLRWDSAIEEERRQVLYSHPI